MLKKLFCVVLIMFCFINVLCEEEDYDAVDEPCDFVTVVDKTKYNNLETASFKLSHAKIIEDCLMLTVSASGCDGNTWAFNLVDSGAVAESSPEQRFLKFQLINNEDCLAFFGRTISFGLKPLQISGSNDVILHIEGLEAPLHYIY